MSKPYDDPSLWRAPYHAADQGHQQWNSQQYPPRHQNPTSESQAEIEMLRQRIEYLQKSQEPEYLHAPPQPYSNNPYRPSSPQYSFNNDKSDVQVPPAPPVYTPTPSQVTRPVSQVSTRLSTQENLVVPQVPRAPTPVRSSALGKIIAIPATHSKLGSPFLRAYAPSLAQYALPPEVFLRFIDNLNRVAVANPPLQILGLAGTITGFVPTATTHIVGNAVSFAAQAGSAVISKGRTELYLRESNKDIFGPRGLKVEIAKTDAIAKLAGIPILDSLGKIDKSSKLLGDLDSRQFHKLSAQERRLKALEQYIEPLDVTPSLPMIEQQSNPLSRLSQAASEHQRKKAEEKFIEDREKSRQKIDKNGAKAEQKYSEEMSKLDKEEEKVRRKENGRKLERELERIEKEREKAARELEKESGKLLKKDKEEEAFRKILWLVIRNLEDDMEKGRTRTCTS